MLGKKVWFNMNIYGNHKKVGTVIDCWYDGLYQVKDDETGAVYISSILEMEIIKN